MSEIKNVGVPNRTTVGALGDIYTDTATGLKYKCTGASTIAGQSDYEWTKIRKPEVKVDVNPVVKEEPKPAVKDPSLEQTEAKTEVKPVVEVEKTSQNPKQPKKERTDYNKQYNNRK